MMRLTLPETVTNALTQLKLAVGLKPRYLITISHPVPENLDPTDPGMLSDLTISQFFQLTEQLHRRKCEPHHLGIEIKNHQMVYTSAIRVGNDHRAMDLMANLHETLCCDTHVSIVAA